MNEKPWGLDEQMDLTLDKMLDKGADKTKWIVGKPKRYHAQHYTPIRENLMGSIMTDVCWVLCGGEYTNLIVEAPSMLEVLKHAVNWGHGFEGIGSRPPWLAEAEQLIRKIEEQS